MHFFDSLIIRIHYDIFYNKISIFSILQDMLDLQLTRVLLLHMLHMKIYTCLRLIAKSNLLVYHHI